MRWVGAALLTVLIGATGSCALRDRGVDVETIVVGGVERTYQVHRPSTVDGAAPLVVMLHGGFGSGRQARAAYGWDELADKAGFVVAYPDGVNRAWSVGDGCCGEPGRSGVDDVAFLEAMVAAIPGIDVNHVYATGMSNGAMMAYRLACSSDRFLAVAPVAGTMLGECAPSRGVSILHIHGLADANVRFDGEPGDGFARIDGPPVPEVIAQWRRHDDCHRAIVTDKLSHAVCRKAKAVNLITLPGVGHEWPADATAQIWQFFQSA